MLSTLVALPPVNELDAHIAFVVKHKARRRPGPRDARSHLLRPDYNQGVIADQHLQSGMLA